MGDHFHSGRGGEGFEAFSPPPLRPAPIYGLGAWRFGAEPREAVLGGGCEGEARTRLAQNRLRAAARLGAKPRGGVGGGGAPPLPKA